jgi:DNA-binding NtrC family response regulator
MDKTILVVEDNTAISCVIEEFLSLLIDTKNVKIKSADNEAAADRIIEQDDILLLVTDVNLGNGGNGLSVVKKLNQRKERPYIILMSSVEWLKSVQEHLDSGLVDTFLNKPFTINDLKSKLKDCPAVNLK